jgi:hypothetical protein
MPVHRGLRQQFLGPAESIIPRNLKTFDPEATVESKHGVNFQPVHDGETGAIRVAESGIFIFEKYFPSPVFIDIQNRGPTNELAFFQPGPELDSNPPAQSVHNQRHRLIEDEVCCYKKKSVLFIETLRPFMIRIFPVNERDRIKDVRGSSFVLFDKLDHILRNRRLD